MVWTKGSYNVRHIIQILIDPIGKFDTLIFYLILKRNPDKLLPKCESPKAAWCIIKDDLLAGINNFFNPRSYCA